MKINMSQQCALTGQKSKRILGVSKGEQQQVKGGDSPAPFCPCEAPLEVLCTVLVLPTQGEHGTAGASPEEDHGVGRRTGAPPQ